jgi:hypothetical protein
VSDLPEKISAYSSATIEAAYFIDGVKQDDAIVYAFSGPDMSCFGTEKTENELTITCYAPSDTPLTVWAFCMGKETSQQTLLVGF